MAKSKTSVGESPVKAESDDPVPVPVSAPVPGAGDPLDPLGCIPQDVHTAVLPCGTIKYPGQERLYVTTTDAKLTRSAFKKWSEMVGCRLDPIVWYKGMGHRPIPEDVQAQMTKEELDVLARVPGIYDDQPVHIGGNMNKPYIPPVHIGR